MMMMAEPLSNEEAAHYRLYIDAGLSMYEAMGLILLDRLTDWEPDAP